MSFFVLSDSKRQRNLLQFVPLGSFLVLLCSSNIREYMRGIWYPVSLSSLFGFMESERKQGLHHLPLPFVKALYLDDAMNMMLSAWKILNYGVADIIVILNQRKKSLSYLCKFFFYPFFGRPALYIRLVGIKRNVDLILSQKFADV